MNVTTRIEIREAADLETLSIEELAAELDQAVEDFQIAVQLTVESAIAVGGILRAAKARLAQAYEDAIAAQTIHQPPKRPVNWTEWLTEHFPYTHETARRWIRLYEYREHIPSGTDRIGEAIAALKGLPDTDKITTQSWRSDEIKAKHKAGWSQRRLADHFCMSRTNIQKIVDPKGYAQQRKEENAKQRAAWRELRRRQKEQAKEKAVKGASRELAEAYASLRRHAAALDAAIGAAEGDALTYLRRARNRVTDAEEEILKAVGVE